MTATAIQWRDVEHAVKVATEKRGDPEGAASAILRDIRELPRSTWSGWTEYFLRVAEAYGWRRVSRAAELRDQVARA